MRPTALSALPTALILATATSAGAVEIVGVAGSTTQDAVLVGSGGEIYARSGTVWKRSGEGGTATTLVAARGSSMNEIWAIGANVPAYRYDGKSWTVSRFNLSGQSVMARTGMLAVAVGTRVYLWVMNKWQLLPALPTPPIAIWAAGPKDAVAVNEAGEIRRWNGVAWKVLPHGLPLGETPRRLFAGPAGQVYAVSDGGAVLRVDKLAVKKILPGALAPANARWILSGVAQNKLWLIGEGLHEGKRQMIVARVEGASLALVDTFSTPDAGDEAVAALVAADGALLVATRKGIVHKRAATGGWTRETVDAAPPPPPTHPPNPPAQQGSKPPGTVAPKPGTTPAPAPRPLTPSKPTPTSPR